MLKRLLILFFIVQVCGAKCSENMPLQTFSNSNRNKTIALGVAIFVVYTIIPNMIDEFEKTSEEGKKESIEFAREADKLLGASLGIYCIYELFTMIRRDFLRYLN